MSCSSIAAVNMRHAIFPTPLPKTIRYDFICAVSSPAYDSTPFDPKTFISMCFVDSKYDLVVQQAPSKLAPKTSTYFFCDKPREPFWGAFFQVQETWRVTMPCRGCSWLPCKILKKKTQRWHPNDVWSWYVPGSKLPCNRGWSSTQ